MIDFDRDVKGALNRVTELGVLLAFLLGTKGLTKIDERIINEAMLKLDEVEANLTILL